MNAPNLQLDERKDPACATAIRSGPPPSATPASIVEQSWPKWGQCAAIILAITIVSFLVFDRVQIHNNTQPTTSKISASRELNHVSRAELLQMPGIGPKLADQLLNYREKIGRFRSIDELVDVPGVGEKTAQYLAKWLYVASDLPAEKTTVLRLSKLPHSVQISTPINVNRASWTELQKLPRVGPVIAQRIIDARAKSAFKSVHDLQRVSGIGPKTVERLRPLVVVK